MPLPFPRTATPTGLYDWGRQLVAELTRTIKPEITPGMAMIWRGEPTKIPEGWIEMTSPPSADLWIVKQ